MYFSVVCVTEGTSLSFTGICLLTAKPPLALGNLKSAGKSVVHSATAASFSGVAYINIGMPFAPLQQQNITESETVVSLGAVGLQGEHERILVAGYGNMESTLSDHVVM